MTRALVWFRRDLRDDDHAALHHAGRGADAVFCAFVFDRAILDRLHERADRRVEFILESVRELDAALRARGGALIVLHGHARDAIPTLARALRVDVVHANRDYEPDAMERDEAVAAALAADGIGFESWRDQVVFERAELRTKSGTPFTVFTPYRRAWLAALTPERVAPLACGRVPLQRPPETLCPPLPDLTTLGFRATNLAALGVGTGMAGAAARFADFRRRIDRYAEARDYPARKGPSYLSVHLRFGTISPRGVARYAYERSLRPDGEGAATWLSELTWRDFYAQLLWHHPAVVAHAFRAALDDLPFRNAPAHVAAWKAGRTGYPIVDAGMRQLAATGYMHNRLRMITASFLVKDLLCDWRIGERHFAQHLLDYELASNNGGWQWAASTGCDAQPWFRVFNPETQSRRFDPDGAFIRRYVPELAHLDDEAIHAPWSVAAARGLPPPADYPPPIVDHAKARVEALALFGRSAGAHAQRRDA